MPHIGKNQETDPVVFWDNIGHILKLTAHSLTTTGQNDLDAQKAVAGLDRVITQYLAKTYRRDPDQIITDLIWSLKNLYERILTGPAPIEEVNEELIGLLSFSMSDFIAQKNWQLLRLTVTEIKTLGGPLNAAILALSGEVAVELGEMYSRMVARRKYGVINLGSRQLYNIWGKRFESIDITKCILTNLYGISGEQLQELASAIQEAATHSPEGRLPIFIKRGTMPAGRLIRRSQNIKKRPKKK